MSQGNRWIALRRKDHCKNCGNYYYLERHLVDHDVANHGSSKEVIHEKSHVDNEHTLETNIDWTNYPSLSEGVDFSVAADISFKPLDGMQKPA